MKTYQIWDDGQVVGIMELYPDEVYEIRTQKEVTA